MERPRPRPFSPKFIVVLTSAILVGYYVMHQGHEGKLVMPGSKSARIAHPQQEVPEPQTADRELMSGSKSGAVFRSKDVVVADDESAATTQPANTSADRF